MDRIYALLTDNGPRYVAYDSLHDIFFTAAYVEIKHAAAAHGWTIELARKDAAENVIDMRSTAVERVERGLAVLEAGKPLSDNDALIVVGIYDFLHATVAPHQRDFPFLNDAVIERWVQELDLRTGPMSNWDTDRIVNSGALWHAVHRPCLELKYPDMPADFYQERVAPTPAQNILAGRYLRSLAYVARLMGPSRMPPEDIVAAWVGKNRVMAADTSFFDEVFELISQSPLFDWPPTDP